MPLTKGLGPETPAQDNPALSKVYRFSDALHRAKTLDEIHDIALVGAMRATGAERAAILLFDEAGIARFKAWIYLSDTYRAAVEGHSPWSRETANAQPVLVPDIRLDKGLAKYGALFDEEKIRALGFIPIPGTDQLLGKFMLYFAEPHEFSPQDIEIAQIVANDVGFAMERKRAEETLRGLNARLEERVRLRTADLEKANRELEAFSYSVSHDLGAPLRSIDSFSALLAESALGKLNTEEHEFIDKVRGSARQMADLIDDLLRLARVHQNPLVRCETDLAGISTRHLARLQALHPKRSVSVAYEGLVEAKLKASVDPDLADMLLGCLLDNAWKFTEPVAETRITIGQVAPPGRPATFFVRDNGIGLDMQYASKLFGPFQRLQGGSQFPGTGMGLAIAARIAERHGGSIWVEATPGEGATFFFTLTPA